MSIKRDPRWENVWAEVVASPEFMPPGTSLIRIEVEPVGRIGRERFALQFALGTWELEDPLFHKLTLQHMVREMDKALSVHE